LPKAIGYTLLSCLLAPLRAFNLVTRNALGTDAIETMRGKIESMFPVKEVRRCYVYSKEDELIKWEDVEEHAGLAQEAEGEEGGKRVTLELFSGPHVAHLKGERKRYTEVVRRLWEE
jgi:hypothetical protein